MRMEKIQKKLICVVGATASGKTGLGLELAKKFNGEIVSADSRQVYRGLDIGTGKDLDDYGCVKYHLIDICKPGESFTMFDWLELARLVLDDIWARGKTPIVVGGTGLYVQALIEGFEIKKTKELKNQRTEELYRREELDTFELAKLQTIAKKLQATSYKLDMDNSRRLIRFIERAQAGEMPKKGQPDFDYLLIGIDLPRDELYAKIDRRVDEWFEDGFYDEVAKLLESGVSPDWLNKIGLEYRILAKYIKYQNLLKENENLEIKKFIENCKLKIENFSSLDTMKQAMKYAIHHYARRQLTWWRRFEVEWARDKKSIIKITAGFLELT